MIEFPTDQTQRQLSEVYRLLDQILHLAENDPAFSHRLWERAFITHTDLARATSDLLQILARRRAANKIIRQE